MIHIYIHTYLTVKVAGELEVKRGRTIYYGSEHGKIKESETCSRYFIESLPCSR